MTAPTPYHQAHALTVDVEDWFHICGVPHLSRDRWDALPQRVVDTTRWLLDLLDRCRIRATFFIVGWIAERHPALVADIAVAGHELGSHSFFHELVYDLTPEQFADDLRRSLRAIAAGGGTTVQAFRAPSWSINDRSLWALDVLRAHGVTLDSSMAPMRVVGNPEYPQHVHRRRTGAGDLVECPPAVERWCGQLVPFGGGWGLRASRPAQVLRRLDRRLHAGRPAVLWIHPWEIDDDPPRTPLPAGLRFAHYFALSGFRTRLEAILRGSTFAPIGDVAKRALAS
jgi:polysaccharide deacetylase family protein (PEP-CTERM system associated)